jgi:hypothetical protein
MNVLIDGFQVNYGNPWAKWPGSPNNNVSQRNNLGRGDNYSLGFRNGQYWQRSLTAAEQHATMIMGVGIYWETTLSNAVDCYFRGDAGATSHITIRITGGTIVVYRGTTAVTVLASVSVPSMAFLTTWSYIEAKVVLHDTTGSVEVRLNGNTTPIINLTNIDTKNGGTGSVFDYFMFSYAGDNTWVILDDVLLNTGAGTANTGFEGDIKVLATYPNADGTTNDFTASTGSRYTTVDDVAGATTGDYVESSTLDAIQLFNFTDIAPAAGSTVAVVQRQTYAAKTEAGSRSVAPVVRSGGANAVGTAQGIGTSGNYYYTTYGSVNPVDSAPWTVTSVNAAEFGSAVKG